MLEKTYDRLRHITERYSGYISTEQLIKEGFTNRQIGNFVEEGKLERISHGNYWLQCADYSKPDDYKAIEICITNPDAVICADSACYYQGLIDQEPQILSVATHRTDRSRMQMNFPIARHYYSEMVYGNYGRRSTRFGDYNIYGIEQSVCDCFRFRNEMEDGMLELVMESYQKKYHGQVDRLMKYAQMLRVGKLVKEFV